jgi:hypothetical protein
MVNGPTLGFGDGPPGIALGGVQPAAAKIEGKSERRLDRPRPPTQTIASLKDARADAGAG